MFRFKLTKDTYPNAVDTDVLFRLLLDFSSIVLEIDEEQILFATSVCSDDLNIVELPHTQMIGPFFLGGLDGFPFVGKSGIGAFSHHIPDEGMALILFGPHVGIGKKGVGKVHRPGQKKEDSDCCGALAGILKILCPESPPDQVPVPNPFDAVIDSQQHYLFDLLSPHQAELQSRPTYSQRFVSATDLIYLACLKRMKALLAKEEFEGRPVIVLGGILINEDNASGSKFAIKNRMLINGPSLKNAQAFDAPDSFDHNLQAFAGQWMEEQLSAISSWNAG